MRFLLVLLLAIAFVGSARAMDLSFEWGDTPSCSTGNPKKIANPVFGLSDVPKETTSLKFKLVDLDVPNYNHGGGTVEFTGQSEISAGSFKYRGPCPPNGVHEYQWTVTALDGEKNALATATAERDFPE